MRGTQKQIEWAKDIKASELKRLAAMIELDKAEAAEFADQKQAAEAEMLSLVLDYLSQEVDCLAADWICCRLEPRSTFLAVAKFLAKPEKKLEGQALAMWCAGRARPQAR